MKLTNKLMLLGILFTMGCSGGNTPESVAVEFTKAVHQCDFKKAQKYCSKETKSAMERQAVLFERELKGISMEITKPEVSVVDCTVSDDNAEAEVRLAIKNSSIIQRRGDAPVEITVDLVNEDGKWVAVFNGR